jgi:predicted CXXCH cytochrome family protein
MKSVSILWISSISFFIFATWTVNVPDMSAGENPCLSCHVEFAKPLKSVHPPLTSGCRTCHVLVAGMAHPEQKDSVRLVQDVPGLCFSCHKKSQFRGKSLHPPVINNTCTVCHNPHQSKFEKILLNTVPGLCYECHKPSKFTGKVVHAPVAKGLCMSCHRPHASNFDNMLVNDPPELCYSCHKKTPFMRKYVHVIAAIPNGCSLCHNAHAGTSPYLLTKPVVKLCTSCHVAQKEGMHIVGSFPGEMIHPVSGVPDPSNPKKELSCVSCHNPHSSTYAKLFPVARLCTKCHTSY